MERIKINLITFSLISLFFISCGTTKVESPIVTEELKEEPSKKEIVTKENTEDDEYSRSIGTLAVSKDTFNSDKTEIISIIEKLSTIMKDFDYKSWLLYIDQESINYWQQPVNLKKAQSKLPVKGLRLRNLEDYFKYVFVPSRAGRMVSEIRYESDTYVKAVQVTTKADKSKNIQERYVVYYYFNKINGHWMLHLPEIGE